MTTQLTYQEQFNMLRIVLYHDLYENLIHIHVYDCFHFERQLMTQYIKVPKALLARSINGYSDEGLAAKRAFHKEGKTFLKKLDEVINPGGLVERSIRNNEGGMAGSGEVTLHSEHMYIQLSESCMGPGVQMMFRSCDSQKDYCGHLNHTVSMFDFANEDKQESVILSINSLIETEVSRKQDQQNMRERSRC